MRSTDRLAMNWLHYIGLAGLILSVAVFILYASGILPTGTAPESVAASWHLNTDEFLERTGAATGIIPMFSDTDGYALSTGALSILATTSLPTLLALAVVWLRKRDWLYAGMALIVSGVLTIAVLS